MSNINCLFASLSREYIVVDHSTGKKVVSKISEKLTLFSRCLGFFNKDEWEVASLVSRNFCRVANFEIWQKEVACLDWILLSRYVSRVSTIILKPFNLIKLYTLNYKSLKFELNPYDYLRERYNYTVADLSYLFTCYQFPNAEDLHLNLPYPDRSLSTGFMDKYVQTYIRLMENIRKACPNLRVIRLQNLPDFAIQALLSAPFPTLRNLHLGLDCHITRGLIDCVNALPNVVVEIDIAAFSVHGELPIHLLAHVRNLQNLRLVDVKNSKLLTVHIPGCMNLSHLNLTASDAVNSPRDYVKAFPRLRTLVSLYMANCQQFDSFLFIYLQMLPLLRKLSLVAWPHTGISLTALGLSSLSVCPHLQEIYIEDCEDFGDEELRAVVCNPRLRKLTVYDNQYKKHITNIGLSYINRANCPNLEYLAVSNYCPTSGYLSSGSFGSDKSKYQIHISSFIKIALSCRNLRVLDLTKMTGSLCWALIDAFQTWQRAKNRKPHLSVLLPLKQRLRSN